MPSFVAGTDLSRAVPRGAHPSLSSVSQDKLSPSLGWLLAWDTELLLLLAGACCRHMECARSWAGTARRGHTRLPGMGGPEPEIALLPVHVQNHSGFTTGCSRVVVYPGASLELPKKCLQGSGLQAAIS